VLSSYIFNNVNIGANTAISGAVIDNATRIKDSCVLETGSVIGPRVLIGDDVTIHSEIRIWPEVTVKKGTRVKESIGNEDFGR